MKNIKIDNCGYSNKKMVFSELEIVLIVNHWHERMMPDIFQDEYGNDLSEVCEQILEDIYRNN